MKYRKLVLTLLPVLFGCISFGDILAQAGDRPLAIIRKFKPDLEVKRNGQWLSAENALTLFNGDTLRTGEEGFAAVQYMDNSLVKIKPNSLISITGEVRGKDNTASRLAVAAGEVMLNVTKRKSDFEVQSSVAVAAVKGTIFTFKILENGLSEVVVVEGLVEVKSVKNGQKANVGAGQVASVTEGSAPDVKPASAEQMSNAKDFGETKAAEQYKKLILQFRDQNGQTRDVVIEYLDKKEENKKDDE